TFELGSFIVGCTKELITESDYREKERGARAEYLPVAQLAYELTERHDGFTEEDLDPESAHDDAIVRPEAWERVRAEKAKEIARLVASGTLKGRGRGKALRVEAGSFYDWLGEPAPVGPAWAAAYEVVPDGEAERAAQHRFRREEAHTAYRKGPTRLVLHLPGVTDEPESRSEMDELVAAHRETFKEGILAVWQQAEAVERVVTEVAREFEGEDPALPAVRHVLEHCREELRELHEDAGRYSGPFEFGEPDEEQLDNVRRLVSEDGP
ncbi:MAG: hypothetical protein U1B78_07745, partial [Dehalococcoidia bacterium]|nr:hypothetical protein [Dehalococcoidia bacterium]